MLRVNLKSVKRGTPMIHSPRLR